VLGRVVNLWRYPVKSLLGERREWLDLNARGVEGDRLFAIRNADGKLASGKNTRRFFKLDRLFAFHAAYDGAIPLISFPDGQTMRGDQPDIDVALSSALGQSLTLVREAGIPHFDAGAVHLLTTASLAWLRSSIPGMLVDERRFRPNLLIDALGATLAEVGWLGKALSVGNEVVLRVNKSAERCAMVVYPQSDLPYDERVLKRIAQKANLNFGVYAEVLVPGIVRHGDSVTVVD
jgi:uncharacterized protein YcbX